MNKYVFTSLFAIPSIIDNKIHLQFFPILILWIFYVCFSEKNVFNWINTELDSLQKKKIFKTRQFPFPHIFFIIKKTSEWTSQSKISSSLVRLQWFIVSWISMISTIQYIIFPCSYFRIEGHSNDKWCTNAKQQDLRLSDWNDIKILCVTSREQRGWKDPMSTLQQYGYQYRYLWICRYYERL